MNRRTALVAVIASALCGGVAALPAAADNGPKPSGQVAPEQGIGIRLLDAAVSRRDDPRAHIYIDDFVHPGSSMTRHVQVTDFTSKPVTLKMYATSSSIGNNGWQVAPGQVSNELTTWMKVTPSTVQLAPGKSATVAVGITVPANASKGERYATVIAELPPPADSKATFRIATRVGVRVYLDVGDGGEPASNFTVSTLTAGRLPDGTPTVSANVTNTGGRALDLGGSLALLDGPGGLRAGPFDVAYPRTLGIGETGSVTVSLDKQTPAGPWLARMALESGFVKHAVTGHLTFPTKAGTTAAPVKAIPVPLTKNRHVLIPVAIGLIGLGILGLLLWFRRRRRREDGTRGDGGSGHPPVVPAQRQAERDMAQRQ